MCALSIVKNENAIEHQYKLEPLHVQLDQHPSPHSFPIQDEPVLSVKHPQRISAYIEIYIQNLWALHNQLKNNFQATKREIKKTYSGM